MPYVRGSFFAGEHFIDRPDAQRRAVQWCTTTAGLRVHGTTACRPAEHFATLEAPVLAPVPVAAYDLPHYATPKVHRDHHVEVAKALYSVPGNLIGRHLDARADKDLVKLFHRGQLVKVHPRQAPGGRSTDPTDLPKGTEVYALRDLERLKNMAAAHGPAVGAYAEVLLEHPLPWTKMRQVYALLGLVKKWGPARVDAACARAADAEAYSVALIGRMLERDTESHAEPVPIQAVVCSRRASPGPTRDFRVLPVRREDRDDRADPDARLRGDHSGSVVVSAPPRSSRPSSRRFCVP